MDYTAVALLECGRPSEAVALARAFADRPGHGADYRTVVGITLTRIEDWDNAHVEWQAALKQDPAAWRAWELEAAYFARVDRLHDCVGALRQVEEHGPAIGKELYRMLIRFIESRGLAENQVVAPYLAELRAKD